MTILHFIFLFHPFGEHFNGKRMCLFLLNCTGGQVSVAELSVLAVHLHGITKDKCCSQNWQLKLSK